VDGQGGARDSAGYFGLRPADPRDGLAKATVAISERPRLNFDQILSKQEGTRGFGCRLRWTPPVAQLLGTTENMRYDARLPVGWNRPHNPKVAGSNPAPATMKKAGFRRTFSRRIRPCFFAVGRFGPPADQTERLFLRHRASRAADPSWACASVPNRKSRSRCCHPRRSALMTTAERGRARDPEEDI